MILFLLLLPAHSYKLPPRPSGSGWKCQEWPKENHIASTRVMIVALGSQCTIKLLDRENGSLFAQCPIDNDKPELSVEPVSDSSRYFVLRVSDGSGRHAYLGMGYRERSDAFEFNVTIQDHIKRLRNEKIVAEQAAAPAAPAMDFSLKGSISINMGGSGEPRKPRAPPPSGGGLGLALAPPPPGGGPSRGGKTRTPPSPSQPGRSQASDCSSSTSSASAPGGAFSRGGATLTPPPLTSSGA